MNSTDAAAAGRLLVFASCLALLAPDLAAAQANRGGDRGGGNRAAPARGGQGAAANANRSHNGAANGNRNYNGNANANRNYNGNANVNRNYNGNANVNRNVNGNVNRNANVNVNRNVNVNGNYRGSWNGRPYYGAPAYRYPAGYGYRTWAVGAALPAVFLTSTYFFTQWAAMGLAAPPPDYQWVRYGPDLLLVNTRTGQVQDVVRGAVQ